MRAGMNVLSIHVVNTVLHKVCSKSQEKLMQTPIGCPIYTLVDFQAFENLYKANMP